MLVQCSRRDSDTTQLGLGLTKGPRLGSSEKSRTEALSTHAMAYILVTKEPDGADGVELQDGIVLQGAFLAETSSDSTGTGRLHSNDLALVATHRGVDAATLAKACIDDANVLPCLVLTDCTTAHPQLTSLRRVLRAKAGALRSPALAVRCGGPRAALDLRLRFLCYQVFKAVQAMERHVVIGELSARTIFVTDGAWCRVLPTICSPEKPLTRETPTRRWVDGSLSTFEYLLLLNRASGRSTALTNDHYVFPWVSDFTVKHGGWRDLSKSKFRLAKGDEMLDRTYAASKHHVTEPGLSDLALCIYLARRAPVAVLQRVVRATFVPEHYPATMERLYAWSPDEAIPEFYCDPSVFASRNGLPDLKVPPWCADAQDFVCYHRSLLEAPEVNANIHKWIDLNFGCSVSGPHAARERNCPLVERSDAYRGMKAAPTTAPGAARLFAAPHPRRAVEEPHSLLDVSILDTYLDAAPPVRQESTTLRHFADRDAVAAVDACLRARGPGTTTAQKCGALLRAVYGFHEEQAVLAPAPFQARRLADSLEGDHTDVDRALRDTDFFPASFAAAHAVGASIEMAADKVQATLAQLDAFSALEFAGALLVLPQMLACLDDNSVSAPDLAAIVDVVGGKVGGAVAYDVLAPRVSALLDRMANDTTFLAEGHVVVAALHRRAGPRAVACLLPALLDASRRNATASAATTLLARLASIDALGPCLAARLVLPALVHDVGRPELFEHDGTATDGRARAVINLSEALTPEAAAPLVLGPLLDPRGRLAELEGALGGATPASRRALAEVLSVLRAFVGRVAPETVQRYYVDLPPSLLPSLLSALTPSPDAIASSEDPFAAAAAARRALDDVAELVSLVAMALGPALTNERLLPDVDRFFAQLVPLRRAPSAAAASLASDVAAGLYAPLSALCGVEETRRRCPAFQMLNKDAPLPPTPPPPPKRRKSNLQWAGEALNAGADWLQRQGQGITETPRKQGSPQISRTTGMELGSLRDARGDSSEEEDVASPGAHSSGSITDDKLWLLPRGRPLLDAKPWDCVDEPPRFGFRLAATPLMDTSVASGASAVLAVDALERTALCGGRDGIVRVWSLRHHPPKLEAGYSAGSIRSLCCVDGDGTSLKAVSCDGKVVDYWDVGRAATIERRAFGEQCIVDVAPIVLGYGPGGAFEGGRSARQLVVLGERALSVVDARGPAHAIAAEWPLLFAGDQEVVASSAPLGERVLHAATARATSCCASPDGAWVATASDQGHIVVTDRRAGRFRSSFRAHGAGIVCVKAASRHEVLSVASDGSAALWRLTGATPKPICVVRGLPNYSGLAAPSVSAVACMRPKPALSVLVAHGHKAAALTLPLGKSTPIANMDCTRRAFVNVRGRKIPRGHLGVEACVMLPARRVALLGCEDGRVRVAA